MKKKLIQLIFYIGCLAGNSQTDTCRMKMGMNLFSLNDRGENQQPFADLMKTARTWMTQDISGTNNNQNTFVLPSILSDTNGYPLQIPCGVIVSGQQQSVATWMQRQVGGNYPAGQYKIYFDGNGTLQAGGDASPINFSISPTTINVTPTNAGVFLKIISSTLGNPVRNIRVMMPGYSSSQIYNSVFLNKIQPFTTLRFMEWNNTNTNTEVQWQNRRKPAYYTQGYDTLQSSLGIAWEYAIRLCNTTGKNCWINIPTQADTNYVGQLAKLFRDSLNPSLKIYLEYSNECWNNIFPQYTWINANGIGTNQSQKTAYFMKKVFDKWQSVFGGLMSSRVIRVAAGKLTLTNTEVQDIMNYLQSNNSDADAISLGAYFAWIPADYSALAALCPNQTIVNVKNTTRSRMTNYPPMLANAAQKSVSFNKPLIFYEGGQSIIASSAPCAQSTIYSAQADTCMYNMYNQWFNILRNTSSATLFMHFHLAGGGTFGSLININDATSQKYQALTDYVLNCNAPAGVQENNLQNKFASFAPNPFSIQTTLESDILLKDASLTVYNLNGKAVKEIKNISGREVILLRENLPSGFYFIRLIQNNNIIETKKLVVVD